MFEDIPLDLRHHKPKKKHVFPPEWLLTPERKQELEASRERANLLDNSRAEVGLLMDGSRLERTAHAMTLEDDRAVRSFLGGKVYKRMDFPKRKA